MSEDIVIQDIIEPYLAEERICLETHSLAIPFDNIDYIFVSRSRTSMWNRIWIEAILRIFTLQWVVFDMISHTKSLPEVTTKLINKVIVHKKRRKNHEQIRKAVLQLIGEGKIDEAFTQLSSSFCKKYGIYKKIILLRNRWHTNEKHRLSNTLDHELVNQEHNRIVEAMIDILISPIR